MVDQEKQSKLPRYRAKKAEEVQEDSDSENTQTLVGLRAEETCDDWIIDSGASRHMTFQKELLHDYKESGHQNQLDLETVILLKH